jgi:DNA (cytosine-5)-methyltransferase 1
MDALNVLSLFNGMSGAYIALKEMGLPIDNYFVSEVDKYANQAAKNTE